MSTTFLNREISSPPASPASFSSISSSTSSIFTSEASSATGFPVYPQTDSRLESPATSPDITNPPKPLLSAPNTRTLRRSFSRPSSSVGLPAFVNNMTFGFKDKKVKSAKNSPTIEPSPQPNEGGSATPAPVPSRTSRLVSATLGRARMQKKKSLVSFLNSVNPENLPAPTIASSSSGNAPQTSSAPTAEQIRPRAVSFDDEDDYGEVAEKFETRNKWATKLGMKMHPYGTDASYMQSFDRVSMDNDRHTEQLLNRLNPSGAPTFYQYGKKPPMTVLDLGCGQGTWVCQAADAWKHSGTIVTGLDLVDVVTEEHENAKFVRGNFVKYPLPFRDESFELVRMANLSLCIPYDKWLFVFSEVKRVLAPNGRLEFIDDQIFFPYGAAPYSDIDENAMSSTTPTSKAFPGASECQSGFDDDDDDATGLGPDGDSNDSIIPSSPIAEGENRAGADDDSFDTASTLVDSDASTTRSARSSMQSNHSVLKKHAAANTDIPISLPSITPIAPITLDITETGDAPARPPPPTRPIPAIPIEEPVAVELITAAPSPSADTITPPDVTIQTPTPMSTPTPSDPLDRASRSSSELLTEPEVVEASTSTLHEQPPKSEPEATFDAYEPWHQSTVVSRELETVFEQMLKEKYGIHPRPHEFVLAAMKTVFGEEYAEKSRSMHVRLAPPECGFDHEFGLADESTVDNSVEGENSQKKPWVVIRWDKKEKKSKKAAKQHIESIPEEKQSADYFSPTALPDGLSAKAASKLGIFPGDLPPSPAVSARQPRPASIDSIPSATSTFFAGGPVQSPGLIVLPSTFIPLSPSELEMHTCKHLHVLLGCKPALKDYIEGFTDEGGQRVCGSEEFEASVWEYECFRRQRFNWPVEMAGLNFESTDDYVDARSSVKHKYFTPSSNSQDYSKQTSYAAEDLTHVRTFRIYGAMKKSDEDAIAPILMKTHSGLPSRPGTSKGAKAILFPSSTS
ncbi:Methyltransferase domain-containing protein [Pleurotus pulmonarius]